MSETLQQLLQRLGDGKVLEFFECRYPSSYESFVDTVHKCMDKAIIETQRAAQYLYDADEDTITTFVVSHLRGQQLNAEHDSDSGGHVDIIIQDEGKKYTWIVEAKIDSSLDWVQSSIPQLMNRYADGTVGANQGGILIYIKNEAASKYMAEWRTYVTTKYGAKPKFRDWNCSTRDPFAFFSECIYNKTDQLFRIRHIGLTLFRQASKDAADLKAAEKKRLDDVRKETERLLEVSTADASALAKELEDLAATRSSDTGLATIAAKARATAEKIDEAAKVAKGTLPTGKRARSKAINGVK